MSYGYEKRFAKEDIEERGDIKKDLQDYRTLKSFYKLMKDYEKQVFTARDFESYRAHLEFNNDIYTLKVLTYYRNHFPSVFKIEKIEEFPIKDNRSKKVEVAQYYADGNPIPESLLDHFFAKGCQITKKTEIKEIAVMGKRYYYSVNFEAIEKILEKCTDRLEEKMNSIKIYANALVDYTNYLEKEMGK